MLAVGHVSKGFSRGGHWSGVLEQVSFEVGPEEVVALVGGRLAGKTTLLRIAAGMERPDRGTVSFNDSSLADLPDRSRARLLGHEIVWVDRDGPGLEVEVSRFVGWPLALHGRGRREVERIAARMLERVGARDCIARKWGELSNSQRVLVGLARGFAGDPKLVIVDDLLDALGARPTEETSDLVRSLIEESNSDCAVLMSASDTESALFADRVFSITSKGKLKLLSGHAAHEGDIIPFPQKDETRGSRNASRQ